ncbi:MAG TPA: glycerophosphodiester phosphodiesterase family protein [Deinococcales bacterium]|nr:glycerophosphodiester phosphodiesterase family protein [Deinococcales bacterium]
MTIRWLAAAGLALGLAVAVEGPATVAADAPASVPAGFDVEGHRGTRGLEPEDTLPAFRHAIDLGVDTLELDVAITRDGVPVVSHSPLVENAICTAPDDSLQTGVAIHSLTLAQVQRFDCGSKPNPNFPKQARRPGTPIPTLAGVLDLAAAAGVRVNVESKVTPAWEAAGITPAPADFVRLILSALKTAGMMDSATLQSFDPRVFPLAKQQAPKLTLAWLVNSEPLDAVRSAQALGVNVYSPDYRSLNEGLVKAMHAAKIRVLPWTVDDEATMRRLIDWNVDGIITDYPDLLLQVIGRSKP